jgi:predicted ester cyclase
MGAQADTVLKAFEMGDSQNFEELTKLQTDDFELTMPGMTVKKQDLEGFYKPTWAGFPDGKHRIDNVIETGDTVVVEALWGGTNLGPVMMPDGEMPATGNRVSFRLASVNKIRGGQVASTHIYFDQMEFLRGMGLVPDMPGGGG